MKKSGSKKISFRKPKTSSLDEKAIGIINSSINGFVNTLFETAVSANHTPMNTSESSPDTPGYTPVNTPLVATPLNTISAVESSFASEELLTTNRKPKLNPPSLVTPSNLEKNDSRKKLKTSIPDSLPNLIANANLQTIPSNTNVRTETINFNNNNAFDKTVYSSYMEFKDQEANPEHLREFINNLCNNLNKQEQYLKNNKYEIKELGQSITLLEFKKEEFRVSTLIDLLSALNCSDKEIKKLFEKNLINGKIELPFNEKEVTHQILACKDNKLDSKNFCRDVYLEALLNKSKFKSIITLYDLTKLINEDLSFLKETTRNKIIREFSKQNIDLKKLELKISEKLFKFFDKEGDAIESMFVDNNKLIKTITDPLLKDFHAVLSDKDRTDFIEQYFNGNVSWFDLFANGDNFLEAIFKLSTNLHNILSLVKESNRNAIKFLLSEKEIAQAFELFIPNIQSIITYHRQYIGLIASTMIAKEFIFKSLPSGLSAAEIEEYKSTRNLVIGAFENAINSKIPLEKKDYDKIQEIEFNNQIYYNINYTINSLLNLFKLNFNVSKSQNQSAINLDSGNTLKFSSTHELIARTFNEYFFVVGNMPMRDKISTFFDFLINSYTPRKEDNKQYDQDKSIFNDKFNLILADFLKYFNNPDSLVFVEKLNTKRMYINEHFSSLLNAIPAIDKLWKVLVNLNDVFTEKEQIAQFKSLVLNIFDLNSAIKNVNDIAKPEFKPKTEAIIKDLAKLITQPNSIIRTIFSEQNLKLFSEIFKESKNVAAFLNNYRIIGNDDLADLLNKFSKLNLNDFNLPALFKFADFILKRLPEEELIDMGNYFINMHVENDELTKVNATRKFASRMIATIAVNIEETLSSGNATSINELLSLLETNYFKKLLESNIGDKNLVNIVNQLVDNLKLVINKDLSTIQVNNKPCTLKDVGKSLNEVFKSLSIIVNLEFISPDIVETENEVNNTNEKPQENSNKITRKEFELITRNQNKITAKQVVNIAKQLPLLNKVILDDIFSEQIVKNVTEYLFDNVLSKNETLNLSMKLNKAIFADTLSSLIGDDKNFYKVIDSLSEIMTNKINENTFTNLVQALTDTHSLDLLDIILENAPKIHSINKTYFDFRVNHALLSKANNYKDNYQVFVESTLLPFALQLCKKIGENKLLSKTSSATTNENKKAILEIAGIVNRFYLGNSDNYTTDLKNLMLQLNAISFNLNNDSSHKFELDLVKEINKFYEDNKVKFIGLTSEMIKSNLSISHSIPESIVEFINKGSNCNLLIDSSLKLGFDIIRNNLNAKDSLSSSELVDVITDPQKNFATFQKFLKKNSITVKAFLKSIAGNNELKTSIIKLIQQAPFYIKDANVINLLNTKLLKEEGVDDLIDYLAKDLSIDSKLGIITSAFKGLWKLSFSLNDLITIVTLLPKIISSLFRYLTTSIEGQNKIIENLLDKFLSEENLKERKEMYNLDDFLQDQFEKGSYSFFENILFGQRVGENSLFNLDLSKYKLDGFLFEGELSNIKLGNKEQLKNLEGAMFTDECVIKNLTFKGLKNAKYEDVISHAQAFFKMIEDKKIIIGLKPLSNIADYYITLMQDKEEFKQFSTFINEQMQDLYNKNNIKEKEGYREALSNHAIYSSDLKAWNIFA